jgi:hypothetical protein
MSAGRVGESEKVPMLQRFLQCRYSPSNELLPERDVISECISYLYVLCLLGLALLIHRPINHFRIAGSDTTSTLSSYFFWEISRRADIMKKLQAELDDAMTDSGTIPSLCVLQELLYLNAFIKEGSLLSGLPCITIFTLGLRLYSAAPSLLERVVHASTSKNGILDEIFDLMGYAVPLGTIVSTQA